MENQNLKYVKPIYKYIYKNHLKPEYDAEHEKNSESLQLFEVEQDH